MPIPYETLFILIIKMTVHSFIQRRHLVSKYMIIPSVVLTESAGSSVITDLKCICQIICVSQAGVVVAILGVKAIPANRLASFSCSSFSPSCPRII